MYYDTASNDSTPFKYCKIHVKSMVQATLVLDHLISEAPSGELTSKQNCLDLD